MNRLRWGLALATALLTPIIGHGAGPAKVEVVRVDDGYTLLRDGTPYLVKGAGAVGSIWAASQRGAAIPSEPGASRKPRRHSMPRIATV